MSVERNKALVAEVIERVFNAHDLDAMDEYYADDYVDHNPQVSPGRAAYKEFFVPLLTAFPDWRGSIEDLIAEGDKVVVRTIWQGTHKAALLGIPATGREVRYSAIDIFRISDEKVVEHWDQVDNLTMLQQLGVLAPIGSD
ncbi:MAG TPA: ester cyclase [Actinomycetes bacterium]|jgi:steroid delta-isomerase-like uncharacterized protein|nr:ester cyclase [Actinomycetes bacterium]